MELIPSTFVKKPSDVLIRVLRIEREKLEVQYENVGDEDLVYGFDFQIEKLVDNDWLLLDIGPVAVPMIAITLKAQTCTTGSVDLQRYSALEQGTYRMIKRFGSHESCASFKVQ